MPVTGPLGEPVKAFWGLLGDGKTAVIEMAVASGLTLVPEDRRNPLITTTYGTGELIKAALDKGCRKLIIGIGGSATNDGGAGMAQALGARFLDGEGGELSRGGGSLPGLARIDTGGLDGRLREASVLVACDVSNPLAGPEGASAVYGPQKGAAPEMVRRLDDGLRHFARIVSRDIGMEVENAAGAGAAGGLGAGLMAFAGGKLTPGIDLVMETVDLERELYCCNLVLTGEGKLDAQSLYGKVPVGVARLAKKYNVPVAVFAGSILDETEALYREGIVACFSIVNGPVTVHEAMEKGALLLEQAVAEAMRFGRLFQ